MNIKKLEIKNFRNLKDKSFNLKHYNAFTGSNEVGKTTTLDALFLLLTGETLTYGKQLGDNVNVNNIKEPFNIKMIVETDKKSFNENGDLVPVEKEFGINYQNVYVLDKETQEEYFSRTDVTYYLNGVKSTKTSYFEEIKDCFNITPLNEKEYKEINFARLLLDPYYMATLDNKVVNKLIRAIVKIPSNEEIIMQNPKFKTIAMKLSKNNFDTELTTKQIISEINKFEGSTMSLEQEVNYTTTLNKDLNYSEETKKELQKELDLKRKQYSDKLAILNKLVEENKTNDKSKNEKIEKLQKEIDKQQEIINNLAEEGNKNIPQANDLHEKIYLCRSQKDKYQFEINRNKDMINNNINYIKEYKNNIITIKCPNCDKEFQYNVVSDSENKINKYLDDNKKLEENNKELEKSIKEVEDKIISYEHNFNNLKVVIDDINSKYNEKMKEYTLLKQKLEEVTNEPVVETKDTLEIENELKVINNDIQSIISSIDIEENKKSKYDTNIERLKRTNELIKQNKALIYDLELQKDLVKDYKIFIAKLTSEKTKEVFGDIEISLVKESKDSSKEITKCFIGENGVNFNGINTANKIVLGIKLIQRLRETLGGKNLPIIFDIIDNIDNNRLNLILEAVGNSQILFTYVLFIAKTPLKLIATNKQEEIIELINVR